MWTSTDASPWNRKRWPLHQQTEDLGRADTSRLLAELLKAATILESHLAHSIGMKLLGKEQAFQFFSYLFNLEDWVERDHLRSDTGIDRQIVKSPVSWEADHLRVGKRHVQTFCLQTPPDDAMFPGNEKFQVLRCGWARSTMRACPASLRHTLNTRTLKISTRNT